MVATRNSYLKFCIGTHNILKRKILYNLHFLIDISPNLTVVIRSEILLSFRIICGSRDIHVEKLKFLFNYFESVLSVPPGGTVSFRKNVFTETQSYLGYESKGELNVKVLRNDMKIESTSLCTHVDFANKHIGGGVLRAGAVQEEIRFLMCPEMMVSMLLCNVMDQFDSISIIGAQAFSSYSGYSNSLKWEPLSAVDAVLNDPFYRDHYGRLRVETIAIDALKFGGKTDLKALQEQCDVRNVYREYFKTMSGFTSQREGFPSPIVSGWWGCGAFRGNKPLKCKSFFSHGSQCVSIPKKLSLVNNSLRFLKSQFSILFFSKS